MVRFARAVGRWSAAMLLAAVTAGCGAPSGSGQRGRPWNLLIVTFDTTRADRIGCYGNTRIQTPTLDRLAAEGVRFARATSAVPITTPSHTTIMTGRYPIAHGVRDNGLFVLGQEQLTLAEMLREHGYATAAAVGAFPLTKQFGLDQGFTLFDDHLTGSFEDYLGNRAVAKERLFFDERRAAQVNEAVLPWLEANAAEPFFVWVHYFDPHQPFEPAPPYDQLYADDLYDGEIAYADSRLGFLLERLRSLGVLDHTLVVMTADHGEGLGEHDELTHAVLAYNSTLHVPLIVRPPAGVVPAGKVVEDWVGTVDVVPTVLELLGIEPPEGLQGLSLVPLMRDETGKGALRHRVRYAENISNRLNHGWGELRVLFDGGLKYIYGPRPELYDLDTDPHEMRDLVAERPEEARRLRGLLEGFLAKNAIAGISQPAALDAESRRRLESLGYLHSASAEGGPITESLLEGGVPPQDRVGDLNDMSAAKHLLFDQQPVEALIYTERLMLHDPNSPLYLELHASALSALGRLDEAWATIERLREVGEVSETLLLQLVARRFEGGQREIALEALRRHFEASPSAPSAWLLASIYQSVGEPAAALSTLEKALELDPRYVPARIDLAVALARAGDGPAAERELERALEDAPFYAKAHYNYGTFLLQDGRVSEAVERFRRALALAPRYLKAHLALVAALVATGQRSQAEEAYAVLAGLAPRSPEAASAAEILAGP